MGGTAGALAAGAGAIGSIYAGQAQASSENYQADVASQNARIARQQANAREEQLRRDTGMALGEQRASAAQSGFDSSVGSFAALQMESAGNAELDALTTRYQGQLQSLSFENEARGHRANAKTAKTQGYLNAFGTLASAGARYGSGLTMPQTPTYSGTGAAGRG